METLPTNLIDLASAVPDEAAAYRMLELLRWGTDRQVCPHCAVIGGHWFLTPANGVSRQTRTGKATQRRLWKCSACRKQFSALTGTIMHRSKIPVRKWLFVLFEMCTSKNGVAAREIERKYSLTPKAAWFMVHRIREAMGTDPLAMKLVGTVEMDETYVGGRRSRKGRTNKGPFVDKAPVVTLVERESGAARSEVMPRVTGKNIRDMIGRHVERTATLYTDQAGVYARVGPRHVRRHQAVNHAANEWRRGDATTNTVEGFFSQLKRSLDGTHHYVSVEHLHRYVGEFDYRYTTRDMSNVERLRSLTRRAGGRRLTYRSSSSEPSASSLVA
jgi:transposase-like protein